MDIQATSRMFSENKARACKWESAFAAYYNISYTEARDNAHLRQSHRVIRLFNLLANVRSLRRFSQQKNNQARNEITKICKDWITLWKSDNTVEIPDAVVDILSF